MMREAITGQSTRIRRYALMLTIVWTCLIVASAAWNLYSSYQSAEDSALTEARASFNKDLVYRRWAALQGGVYVPISDLTPPNPYLLMPEREITTASGRQLTLVNPAYMTRQVHELGQQQYGAQGHITSLNPLRPENAPDAWEAQVLRSFEQGEIDTYSVERINGKAYMRYMHVMVVEDSCLKCHATQGYQIGDVRGGISVSVPIQPFWDAERSMRRGILWGHGALWLAGLIGIVWASRKIHEADQQQQVSTEELRESAEQYTLITSTAMDGFWILDVDRHILDVNDVLCRVLGYSRDELLTMRIEDIEAQESAEEITARIEEIKTKGVLRFESRQRRKDGQIIDVEVSVTYMPREQRLMAFLRDISKRKYTEQAILDSERRYRQLFENMTAGFALHEMLYDDQGQPVDYRFLDVNPAFERLTGLVAAEIVNKTIKSILPAIESSWIEKYGKVAQTGEPVALQDYAHVLGRHYDVWAFSPAPNQFATVFTDITARKQDEAELQRYREHLEEMVDQRTAELAEANQQLQILSRAKDEFVSNVSHELRTPLTNLTLRYHLLENHPDHLSDHMRVIKRETARLTQTIDDLLSLSRLDQRRVTLTADPINLNEMIEHYVLDRGLIFQRKGLTLDFQPEPTLPTIVADQGLLGQVLSILLTNASNYTPSGGSVTVKTQFHKEHAWIGFTVADTGPGIMPDDLPKLFTRFFRGQVGRAVPGTGLGLAIAKEIVTMHEGTITVDSIPGQGASFTVWLPR